jgi:uncharacterized protein (DUF58 family)
MPAGASIAETADAWSQASSPVFLRRLDRLRINVRGGTGHHPGNNPVASATQDSGLEFAKHRPYLPGDDLRHIDWSALARHDAKLVKTFRAEREAPLHVLVDTSASMATPAADGKLEAAAGIATTLAYISLRNRDPVRIAALDATGAHHVAPLLRHPHRLHLIDTGLRAVPATGTTDLEGAVGHYLGSTRLPGIAILISDFLVQRENYQRAMRRLQAAGYTVAALRVLGRQERDPAANTRRIRLYDVEARRERIVDLSSHNRALYRRALQEHTEDLQSWCTGSAIPFCVIDTDAPPGVALTSAMTRAGILR